MCPLNHIFKLKKHLFKPFKEELFTYCSLSVSLIAGLPRRAPPVQAPDRAVQSVDTEVDCRIPRRRHEPHKENYGTDQSALQQSQFQVGYIGYLCFTALILMRYTSFSSSCAKIGHAIVSTQLSSYLRYCRMVKIGWIHLSQSFCKSSEFT